MHVVREKRASVLLRVRFTTNPRRVLRGKDAPTHGASVVFVYVKPLLYARLAKRMGASVQLFKFRFVHTNDA